MKLIALLFLAFFVSLTNDQIATEEGTIEIIPIRHASLALKWNNTVMLADPHGDTEVYEQFQRPRIILITDIHGDHLDTKALDALDTEKSIVVAPAAVAAKLDPEKFGRIVIIKNGESTEIDGVNIEAIAMYNLPEEEGTFHTKGRGNGYVLTMLDRRIYISGDTEDISEMRKLQNIDVAFVCMNLPYTMNIEQAASAVLEFKPKIVYPFHYRGKDGKSDVQKFKQLVNNGDARIDVRLRDWYGD